MSDLGGGIIRSFSFSKAWGTNPSAATGEVLIDAVGGVNPSLAVGDYLTFAFGSLASFPGVVSEVGVASSFGQGLVQTFQVVDNRVRLGWQSVFGAWNIEDDTLSNHSARPPSPSTGPSSGDSGDDALGFGPIGDPPTPVGVDSLPVSATPWAQRRRYKHLLPQHFQSGLWTYTDTPLTTTEILNSAFNNAWGDYGFTRNYHAALNTSILTGLDYTSGIKLANLISEINSKCGLEITISGSRTLIWGRKGDGLPPLPDSASTPISNGSALTSVDSAVRVVGERTRIQKLNIGLEPDWNQAWNAWIDEAAWRREVAAAFEMPTATKAEQLVLSAFARHVTVYQYAKKKEDFSLLDTRPFGRVSRSALPAWVYIRELVYRSYRIPPDFVLHGVPLSSMDFADSLICNTDVTGEGLAAKQCYADSPIQFYPSVQATVIVRGQPLDLINARDIRLFYRNSTEDLRNEWTAASDFEVDAIGKSIRFAVPTFIDGDAAEGKSIFLRINKGEGGGEDLTSKVAAGSDYLDVVVPNPGFEIYPAQVQASFCFLMGRFFRDYGVSPRRGFIPASGLDLHVLDMADDDGFSSAALAAIDNTALRLPDVSGSFKELLYEDGVGAIAKANAVASSALELSAVQDSGGFTRNGVVGTSLTPVVDRITVNINFNGGVTEEVQYTKARTTTAALAERTMQRIQRTEELFSGQESLKREIREYRLMAAAERRPATSRDGARESISDALNKPVGGESPQVHTVKNNPAAAPEGVWRAGHFVWLDAAGVPTATGGTFGGVLVAKPHEDSTELSIAYAGRVPALVAANLPVNSVIAASPGESIGTSSGAVTIGRLAHGEATPDSDSGEVLAMVDLGGGSAEKVVPLHIVGSRPQYMPVPGASPAEGARRYWIEWGTVNDLLATNWDDPFDVSETTYFFAKVYLRTTSTIKVTSWEIVTGPLVTSHETPEWLPDEVRPAYVIVMLGAVTVTTPGGGSPVFSIQNGGGGSFLFYENIARIEPGSAGVGDVDVTRQVIYHRLQY